MNDQVQVILAGLIKKYGTSLVEDPKRLEGFLRDMCGEQKKEIAVIIAAKKERVAEELLALAEGTILEIHMARLQRRLVDNLALADAAALWAVQAWMVALGLKPPMLPEINAGENSEGNAPDKEKQIEYSPGIPVIFTEDITNVNSIHFYMKDWARRVTNLDDLPERFRRFMTQLTSGSSPSAPYIIYAPADQWGKKETNPKLFCVLGDGVVFLEESQAGLTHYSIPIEEINSIENGNQLLYSWFKITGKVGGQEVTAIMEYNNVVKNDIVLMGKLIRTALFKSRFQTPQSAKEPDQYKNLVVLNNIYSEVAKESIIPGEKVLGFVYQSLADRNLVNPAFGNQIIILTDREIILFRRVDKQYGTTQTYLPLSKIKRIAFEENFDGYISLIINQSTGETMVSVFASNKFRELQNFIDLFDRVSHL